VRTAWRGERTLLGDTSNCTGLLHEYCSWNLGRVKVGMRKRDKQESALTRYDTKTV
jgi:hypothetical protein